MGAKRAPNAVSTNMGARRIEPGPNNHVSSDTYLQLALVPTRFVVAVVLGIADLMFRMLILDHTLARLDVLSVLPRAMLSLILTDTIMIL